jgi:hypothetical protein
MELIKIMTTILFVYSEYNAKYTGHNQLLIQT